MRAAALWVLVAWPGMARADIYKRVAADGTVEFSNMPEGRGWERILSDEDGGAGDGDPRVAERAARRSEYAPHVTEAARRYSLPEALVLAVIDVESAWNPVAVSRAGAMGLMQLMPGTARAMRVRDAFDPRQNILGGVRYLRLLANRYDGDIVLTLSAYNAGEGTVEREGGVPYEATKGYVEAVLERYRHYRGL